jgi:thymidylate synthase
MKCNMVVALYKNYLLKQSPMQDAAYASYFESLTDGGVVVMGRAAFAALPATKRPYPNRVNVVFSTEYPKYRHMHKDNLVFSNAFGLHNQISKDHPDKGVWIAGGAQVFESTLDLCGNVYIVLYDKKGDASTCQRFTEIGPRFELVESGEKQWSEAEGCHYRILHYTHVWKSLCLRHEQQYLDTLLDIMSNGSSRPDRTGTGTVGVFGGQHRYDVSKYLPILTTKFVPIGVIIKELLWFLRGETNAKLLQAEDVRIWDGNSSRSFLDGRGLHHYAEGDIGPGYGFQFRHFGAAYAGCDRDYTGQGVDQIEYILDLLRTDPFSRRIILTAWNPADLSKMALPPCHITFQLYVEEDRESGVRHLSGHLYQRSSDYFLAANYNLVSYTVLLYILAKKVGYYPKTMIMSFGDAHIYSTHLAQVKEQMGRAPRPQPALLLDDSIRDKAIEDISIDDFEMVGYMPHPAIKAAMAI